VDLRGFEPLTS